MRKIKKKINIGENEQYDKGIEALSKSYFSNFAKKLGEVFQNKNLDSMNVDTFIESVTQVVTFCKKRNAGLLRKDEAYISDNNIIDLINRYPRLLLQNPLQLLEEKVEIIDDLNLMDNKELNILIKSSKGYLYSVGSEKLNRTLAFLNEIKVLLPKELKPKNAAKYLLQDLGESNLQVSTEKIFQRVLHIVTVANTNIIPKKDFDFCFKRNDKEYQDRYGKSKEQLSETYILPMTKDRQEYSNKVKYIVERQARDGLKLSH